MQPYGICKMNDFCSAVCGERWRAGWIPLSAWAQPGGHAEGHAQLCHAQCWLVWTRGPQGTQQQLPDGSEWLLNGHSPVGRLVWQSATICLPAPTNPLHSPDTHTQTLFTSNTQGRKASVFGLASLRKPGLSGVLLCAQEFEEISLLSLFFTVIFP